MNILFLRGFNNYFNRTLKIRSTLESYQSAVNDYLDYSNINFDPKDGFLTEIIVGSYGNPNSPQTEPFGTLLDFEENGCPDYAVCYEGTTIKSRWFVIEAERTRAGQYRVSLKRDVLVDFYTNIKNAPCFIEKGLVNDQLNPLLFNKENMILNQIKKNEHLLKDRSGCAWVVGYIPSDFSRDSATTVVSSVPYTGIQDITVNGLSDWQYYSYYTNKYSHSVITMANITSNFVGVQHLSLTGRYPQEIDQNVNVASNFTWYRDSKNNTNIFTPKFPSDNVTSTQGNATYTYVSATPTRAYVLKQDSEDIIPATVTLTIDKIFQSNQDLYSGSTIIDEVEVNKLKKLNNKIIYDSSNGKYYKISVKYSDTNSGIRVGSSIVVRPTLTMYSSFVNSWASRWGTDAVVKTNYTSKNVYI